MILYRCKKVTLIFYFYPQNINTSSHHAFNIFFLFTPLVNQEHFAHGRPSTLPCSKKNQVALES